jgi:hypothetical protein
MPGLMARILGRANGALPTAPPSAEDAPAEEPTVVVPALTTEAELPPEEAEQPTMEEAAVEAPAEAAEPDAPAEGAAEPLPAGAERVPDGGATFRNRGKLRRRLRYLRQVRELGFRDLGGLVFDLDRFGRERPDLVELKLAGLRSIDAELRALEGALDDAPAFEELHEPGISACLHCGALLGSEANYCSACGKGVHEPPIATFEVPAAPSEPVSEDGPAPEQPAA